MAVTFTPISGLYGRITYGNTNIAVYGLNEWEMVKKTTPIPIPHFEITPDSDGNYYPTMLLGMSGATVTFAGFMNTNGTDATDSGTPGLSNGLTVTMDFILVKATPFGFSNVSVFIDGVTIGTKFENTGASYKGSGTVTGNAPKTSTVT